MEAKILTTRLRLALTPFLGSGAATLSCHWPRTKDALSSHPKTGPEHRIQMCYMPAVGRGQVPSLS